MIREDDLNKKRTTSLTTNEKFELLSTEFKMREGETRAEQMARVGKSNSGKNKVHITENQIRYAMENTNSNVQAGRFLGVSRPTYTKYAKMYIDEETGKSLYELEK